MILCFLVYFVYSSGTYLPLNKLHIEGSCFARSFSKSKVLELVKIRSLGLGNILSSKPSSLSLIGSFLQTNYIFFSIYSSQLLLKLMFHYQNLCFTTDYPHCGCPVENIPWESHEAHKDVSRPMYEHLQSRSKIPFTFAHVAILIRTMDLSL